METRFDNQAIRAIARGSGRCHVLERRLGPERLRAAPPPVACTTHGNSSVVSLNVPVTARSLPA